MVLGLLLRSPFSTNALLGALLLSIGFIRYCNADVDTGPFIKGICTWCLEQHFSPIVSQLPRNKLWCFGLEHCLYSLLQCSICSLVPWYWVSSYGVLFEPMLYTLALVSLTMQDTPGKFDDIASVNCVCIGKRHRNVCDFHWFPFRMTCYTFLCKGLIHQALSLYAIEVPSDVSISFIRYCRADVDIRPYMKGMYLMSGIVYAIGCFTSQHWLYRLLQCWCWHRTIHQGYLYLMFGTEFFTHSFTAAS